MGKKHKKARRGHDPMASGRGEEALVRVLLARPGSQVAPPTDDDLDRINDDLDRVAERARAGAEPGFELSVSVQYRLDEFLRRWRARRPRAVADRLLKDIARRLEAQCPDPAGRIAEVRLMTHRTTRLQQWQVAVLAGDEPNGVIYANPNTLDSAECQQVLLEARRWYRAGAA